MGWFFKETKPTLGKLILECAEIYELDPLLIAAIILTESGGNTLAGRYEPAFFRRYVETKTSENLGGFVPRGTISLDTEKNWRATSWGLMQVMGQTAREHGFKEVYLTSMLEPKIGIQVGCMVFSKYLASVNYHIDKALLRYNGGGNKDYPALVLSKVDSGKASELLNK